MIIKLGSGLNRFGFVSRSALRRTRLRSCQRGALPQPAHAPKGTACSSHAVGGETPSQPFSPGISERLVFKPFVCKVRTLILNGTQIAWSPNCYSSLTVFGYVASAVAHAETWPDLLAVDSLGAAS